MMGLWQPSSRHSSSSVFIIFTSFAFPFCFTSASLVLVFEKNNRTYLKMNIFSVVIRIQMKIWLNYKIGPSKRNRCLWNIVTGGRCIDDVAKFRRIQISSQFSYFMHGFAFLSTAFIFAFLLWTKKKYFCAFWREKKSCKYFVFHSVKWNGVESK